MTKKGGAADCDWPAAPELTNINNVPHGEGRCKWFRFGLRGSEDEAKDILDVYPPMVARNKAVEQAQVLALTAILSNATDGEVTIRNFQKLKATEYGFGREVIRTMLEYSHNQGIIEWRANGTSMSTIIYREGITVATNIRHHPPHAIEASIKDKITNRKQRVILKLNTKLKKSMDKRIRAYWDFILQHDILHNVDRESFGIVAAYYMVMDDKKKKPSFPNNHNICPVAVYNDRSVSIGGRFYRAFWIGLPSGLRRMITIDDELTADIDGKAMHVQLLYGKEGQPVPDGEMYIYPKPDPRRKIAKRLMLLMMNTRKTWPGNSGRVAVIKTYKAHYTVPEGVDLMTVIKKLEKLHKPIRHLLYQSNWGELQCTEAGIMLLIMEAAMQENIVVLPVHDGCLCQRKHRDRVLELFIEQGIKAEENMDHLQPLDLENMREFYDLEQEQLATENRKQIARQKRLTEHA